MCVAPECPAGRKAHTHDRFDLSLFSWQICRPAKVSGISVQAKSSIGYRFNDQSLSLSFWFRDLSVLFTSQTLSLSGGGRFERKKRNLSFLLTERTIRHVNPLHFFPPIIHPCLRYYFRLLFFFFLLLSSRAKSLWYKTKLARSSTRLSPLVVVLVRVFYLLAHKGTRCNPRPQK